MPHGSASDCAACAPSQLARRREVWLAVGLGFLAAFIVLAALLADDHIPAADRDVANWIRGIDFFAWDAMVSVGEALTGSPYGVIVWFAAVAGFWASGRPVEAIVLAFAAAIWVPKAIAEELVDRTRPILDGIEGSALAEGGSFPSGHITAGFAVYGMLAVIAVVRLQGWRPRAVAIFVAAAVLTLAAFSRVVDGVHWPSDVLGGFLLGLAWVAGVTVLYRDMRRDQVSIPGLDLLRRMRRRGRPAAPVDRDIAGSIASTVYLDREAGTATKVYRPPRAVRWMYWAAFQSSFPYATREEALRTAAAVRELTGLLTQYWTGDNMVAGVTEIRCERGEFYFVTELVEGEEPRDNAEVRDVLLTLRRRFGEAGLATWQIDAENPHAYTNFIRTAGRQAPHRRPRVDLGAPHPTAQPAAGHVPHGTGPHLRRCGLRPAPPLRRRATRRHRGVAGPRCCRTARRGDRDGRGLRRSLERRGAELVGPGGAQSLALDRLGTTQRPDPASIRAVRRPGAALHHATARPLGRGGLDHR